MAVFAVFLMPSRWANAASLVATVILLASGL
jgi:hypothetical protein